VGSRGLENILKIAKILDEHKEEIANFISYSYSDELREYTCLNKYNIDDIEKMGDMFKYDSGNDSGYDSTQELDF